MTQTRAAQEVSCWRELQRAVSPTEDRPCVVLGIEASHHTSRRGQPYVVIHSPAAGTYLKLDRREYDLLPLMDGSRTVRELVLAYYKRHKVLALPRIAALVRLLGAHQFLVEPPLDAYGALRTRLRARQSLLHAPRAFARRIARWELSSEGGDALLAAWYRAWGRFFFAPSAVALGILLGVLGPVLFVHELTLGRYDPLAGGGSSLSGFVLLLVLMALALVVHELGHGLAVKHADRRVKRCGFTFYYGFPAAFVDTTDMWMAPPRMRLLVSFAGPWAGLIFGGLCSVAVLLLPEGPLGAVLYAASFICLATNLMNFNPLLEMDGYYLLVDLVEKPLLRARAFAFVRGPLWGKLWRRQPLSREEQFFAFFGVASASFTVLAIAVAARFWQFRLIPTLADWWLTGDSLARLTLVLGAIAVAAPLTTTLWVIARWWVLTATEPFSRFGRQARVRRHREAFAALRAVPLWASLPEARLFEVARAMRAVDVRPGTAVVSQGNPGGRFYLIASGLFEVQVDDSPTARLLPGAYFGERALLDQAPHQASIVALVPSRVYALEASVFHATLAHDVDTRARLDAALAYRAQVAAMPLFRDLSPTELDLLLTRLVPRSVEAGDEIIREGAPDDRFYVVRDGSVEVARGGVRLAVLRPGEPFGEIAPRLHVLRTASVRALERTHLLMLEGADLRDLLAGYCGLGDDLQRVGHSRLEAQLAADDNPGFDAAPAPVPIPTMLIPQGASPTL